MERVAAGRCGWRKIQRVVSHTMGTVIRVKIIRSSTLPMCHLDAGSLVAIAAASGGSALFDACATKTSGGVWAVTKQ
jgi:fructose-1,6-bisphosphatase/inositol monophosphatase family enzyme